MAKLDIERVGTMSPPEEERFWKAFEHELANDDGATAAAHLAAGRPIHYGDDRFPNGVIRRWPNGREELLAVDFSAGGVITVVRAL